MALAFQLAVFLGAFLLFLVQPLIGKQILPWFGGGSAVWSACLLFFQLALVVGYAYAHHLRRLAPGAQIKLHLLLLAAAAATLPIVASPDWKPPDGERLVPRVLTLLAATVGAPYVLLASTAPLLQDWYARLHPGRSPYWLYVLSNTGSLAALAVYPTLVEPRLAAGRQSLWWSAGFVAFGLLSGWCAWRVLQRERASPVEAAEAGPAGGPTAAVAPAPPPSYRDQLLWLAWPAVGTGLLLATTSAMTQDVAAVPLLWIAPLAVYLLTFIVTFAGIYSRAAWAPVFIVAVAASWFMAAGGGLPAVKTQAAVLMVALASGCMVCHGELVRLRPPAARLTEFYLALAVGGSFGGVFVAVAAPIVFDGFHELPLLYLAALSLLLFTVLGAAARRWMPRAAWLGPALAAILFIGGTIGVLQARRSTSTIARARSYYGVLRVVDDPPHLERRLRRLYHGRILHGTQFMAQNLRTRPTSYYSEGSGVDLAIRRHPRRLANETLQMGVVGLGTGTIAALSHPGDRLKFFEIDPLVIDISRQYFTYLRDARGRVEIVTGDARLSLEREMTLEQNVQTYDVIAVDAFSGDSVPVHLLTREMFALYDRALRPDGILALHVSNRYLDLRPVVHGAVVERGMKLVQVVTADNAMTRAIASTWLLATRNEPFVAALAESGEQTPHPPRKIVWTDDFSSLLTVLR
jgi:spermidine synthase